MQLTRQAGGHKDVVALLVSAKASVHAVDQNGVTALIYAAHGGHSEVVSWLLQHGAQVNARTKAGESAVMGALVSGYMSTAIVLCEAGADVNAGDTVTDGLEPELATKYDCITRLCVPTLIESPAYRPVKRESGRES